jgi:hypothetical protein
MQFVVTTLAMQLNIYNFDVNKKGNCFLQKVRIEAVRLTWDMEHIEMIGR